MKNWTHYILLLLLIGDLIYSFNQYLGQPLDGDMAWNLVPHSSVTPTLENPIGISTIISGQTYSNPNRFFCHWGFREYLINMPLKLQSITTPINSVYWACAILKITTHIGLLFVISYLITNKRNFLLFENILSMFLLTLFFQTNGYGGYMGIIDPSTTYTFFYAFPLLILLITFIPLVKSLRQETNYTPTILFWALFPILTLITCLSGPLNPGVILATICTAGVSLIIKLFKTKNISKSINSFPNTFYYIAIPLAICSMYSLYLGSFNSLTINNSIPLSERISKLPLGVFYQFTQKLGWPVLFLAITINTIFLKRISSLSFLRAKTYLKWIAIFSVIYILALPFGGYREYRPYILRYDTILPVTILMISFFTWSTLTIFRQKNSYFIFILAITCIYSFADKPNFDKNRCEKSGLHKISNSTKKTVLLNSDCNILSWSIIKTTKSRPLESELLTIWNITDEQKYFYKKK